MIKYYSIFSLIILLAVAGKSVAQTYTDTLNHQRPETVFIEVGAAGLVFSANYDTRFTKKRNGWGGRAGIGYFADAGDNLITLPLQVNYLFGRKSNFFELGAGITYGSINDSKNFPFDGDEQINGAVATVTIGFRHQPIKRGVYYKISFDPIFDTQDFSNMFPYFGIGLGYTFK